MLRIIAISLNLKERMKRNNQDVTLAFSLFILKERQRKPIYIYPLRLSDVEKRRRRTILFSTIARLFDLSPPLSLKQVWIPLWFSKAGNDYLINAGSEAIFSIAGISSGWTPISGIWIYSNYALVRRIGGIRLVVRRIDRGLLPRYNSWLTAFGRTHGLNSVLSY